MMYQNEYSENNNKLLVAVLLAIVSVAFLIALGTLSEELTLTKHAENNRLDETWNVSSIEEYMRTGKCNPKNYVCEDQDIEIFYCQLEENPKLSIGLIVGHTLKNIITGFAARNSYWQNRCG